MCGAQRGSESVAGGALVAPWKFAPCASPLCSFQPSPNGDVPRGLQLVSVPSTFKGVAFCSVQCYLLRDLPASSREYIVECSQCGELIAERLAPGGVCPRHAGSPTFHLAANAA